MKISNQLKEKYSDQYTSDTDEWRFLGGRGKAINIVEISKGVTFNTVLDVGSGDGSVLYWLDKYNFSDNIKSVEISESGIAKIESKKLKSVKEIKLFDGYKLPFDDDTFDLALCSHVIEHVEFPRTLIREITRVSKHQIFEIPIDFSFNVDRKVDHFLSYGHINIYAPQTFRFLLQSEGLKIESYKNLLYEKEIHDFMYKDAPYLNQIRTRVKRILWRIIPFLMRFKPDITITRTSKIDSALEIMKK